MRLSRLCLVLAGLIVLARMPLTGQTMPMIRAVQFFPPAKSWDTTDHVDVQVRRSVQVNVGGLDSIGHRIPNEPLRWFTLDATVARVSATGLVTGVARGQTQIGVEVGVPGQSMHGLLLVCVDDQATTALELVPGDAQDTTRLVRMPAQPNPAQRAAIVDRVQLAAADLRTPSIAWDAPCVHWRSLNPAVARVSRRGLVTVASGRQTGVVGIVAGVGPVRP